MSFSEEDLQAQALELQKQLALENEDDFDSESSEDLEQEETSPEFKKYVVRIKSEYISMVEQLSYEERNLFMNELLEDYIKRDIEQEESDKFSSKVKMAVFSIIFVILGIPLLIWMLTMSLNATHANYKDMQDKFTKLYQVKDHY